MQLPLANLLEPYNLIWIGLIALLLFGKRLPEVGRSLGKGIVEFKKGLQGIGEEMNDAANQPPIPPAQTRVERPALASTSAPAGYKFDPYTGKPLEVPAQPQMRYDPYTGKPLSEDAASQSASSNG